MYFDAVCVRQNHEARREVEIMMNLGTDLPRPYTRRGAASAPASRSRAPFQQQHVHARREVGLPSSVRRFPLRANVGSHGLLCVHDHETASLLRVPSQVYTRGLTDEALADALKPFARLPAAVPPPREAWATTMQPRVAQVNLALRVLRTAAPGSSGSSGGRLHHLYSSGALPTRSRWGPVSSSRSSVARTPVTTLPR